MTTEQPDFADQPGVTRYPTRSQEIEQLSLIELIDRYARIYHRWARQPTNAELDTERKQLRERIVKTLAESARIINEHMEQFHADWIALDEEREQVPNNIEITNCTGVLNPPHPDWKIISYGPVLYPPHPSWKVISVTPIDPS